MRRSIAPLFLAALAAGATLPPLLAQRTPVPTDLLAGSSPWTDADPTRPAAFANRHQYDILIFTYPHEVLAARALQGGELPWWDPTTLSGHPLLADSQTGTLYPPKLLLQATLPPSLAYALFLTIHLGACGIGMYAYLRHAGCGRPAATVGAVIWMLSGQSTVWYKYGTFHALGTLLPVALLCLDRLDGERPRGAAAGLALALAGILLSTHAQLLYYVAMILLAAAGARWGSLAASAETRPRALRGAVWAAAAVALGLALAAPQVLPLADLALHRHREAITDRFPSGMTYAALLATFLFPRLFGGPLDRVDLYAHCAGASMTEFQGYIGFLPLALLVPLGVATSPRRERWLWGGLAATAVLCATGTPLDAFLSAVFPGLADISPFKILYLYVFAVTIFAARGAEALLAAPDAVPPFLCRWRWGLAAGWAAGLAAAAGAEVAKAAGHVPPGSFLRWINIANPVIHLPLLWWGGTVVMAFLAGGSPATQDSSPPPRRARAFLPAFVVALATIDLLQFFLAYNPTHDPATLDAVPAEYAWLRAHQSAHYRIAGFPRLHTYGYPLHGVAPLMGLSTAEGYESLYSGAYRRLTDAAGPFPTLNTHVVLNRYDSNILDLLSIRYVLVPPDAKGIPSHFHEVFRDRMVVYENSRALSRAYLVHGARGGVSESEALALLQSPAFRPHEECLLADAADVETGAALVPEPVRITGETFNTLRMDVSASAPGLLVVTDTWDPGWEATLDGAPAPVLRVNVAQRAVPVPAGAHRVEMRYAPRGIGAAWGLCGAGLAGTLALALCARRGRAVLP